MISFRPKRKKGRAKRARPLRMLGETAAAAKRIGMDIRQTAFFYVHRQSGFGIKPDTVNPLDGIVFILAGAYLEAYAIAFVNLPKGLLVI